MTDPLDRIARGGAEPGPFVRGRIIQLPGIVAEREDNFREIRTWQLRPEIFFEHEDDDMLAAREVEDPEAISYRFLHHRASVVGPPDKWFFIKHGLSSPEDIARDNKVMGIPSLGMQKVMLDRYGWIKHTGENIYDAVQHANGRNWRRLLRAVFDRHGDVVAVDSCIKSEPMKVAA